MPSAAVPAPVTPATAARPVRPPSAISHLAAGLSSQGPQLPSGSKAPAAAHASGSVAGHSRIQAATQQHATSPRLGPSSLQQQSRRLDSKKPVISRPAASVPDSAVAPDMAAAVRSPCTAMAQAPNTTAPTVGAWEARTVAPAAAPRADREAGRRGSRGTAAQSAPCSPRSAARAVAGAHLPPGLVDVGIRHLLAALPHRKREALLAKCSR